MTHLKDLKLSPAAISFIPLFYVAWSDSVLSPSEIRLIQNKMNSFKFLSDPDREYLTQWTDPKHAPSESEFRQWRILMIEASRSLNTEKKMTLIELGIAMSGKGIQYEKKNAIGRDNVTQALTEIHDALGLTQTSDALLFEGLLSHDQEISANEYNSEHAGILHKLLDGEHYDLKNKLRRLLRDPAFAIRYDLNKDQYRKHVLSQVKILADHGFSAYSFPKKFGGYGKKSDHIAVFEMLGYGDLSLAIKFGVQFGLFGGAIHMLGTEKHHIKYIESLHKAQLLGCFAMTEIGHGSNVKNLETTAVYQHETRQLIVHSPSTSAGKEYIGNALHSSLAVVFAQLMVSGINHGVHAVLVPIRNSDGALQSGITYEDCGYKMGLNGVDNGRLWFDKVTVPVENLLDKYGSINTLGVYESPIKSPSKRFFTMLAALVVGRISVGLLGINASKVALTIALKYGLVRRQFAPREGEQEKLILDYPSHQKRLFPLLAKNYAYYFALQELSRKYANAKEADIRKIETLAAGLKAKATWYATECIQVSREACGGKGYLSENRFAALKADSDIFTTFEGDNTVLMQLVAKGLLTEFKQTFHEDGYRAVLRTLLTKVKHEGYENNPIFKRNTDSSHLLDPKFHFHAFNYRQRKILISLSERMRKYIKRGIDPYQAFLKVQNHMIDLADAYIDLIVLQSFYEQVDRCKDLHIKKSLQLLAHLYALTIIQENKGWFLESDYMDGSKTKAIRRIINKLYQDIRPMTLYFVEAFAIPDELIAAPIAV